MTEARDPGSPTRAARRRAAWLRPVISHVLLVVVALLFAAPLVYAFATSLKPQDEVFTRPPTLVGSELRWENYVEAFRFAPFGRYFFNSFLVAIIGTAGGRRRVEPVGVRIRPAAVPGPRACCSCSSSAR